MSSLIGDDAPPEECTFAFISEECMSHEIDKLAAAISKAQITMVSAVMDSNNPHYNSSYASLSSVIEACKPLHELGVATVQLPTSKLDDNGTFHVFVRTTLIHESGQWISSKCGCILPNTKTLRSQAVIQTEGGFITYLRRYALSAMAGIAQEDCDGNDKPQDQHGNKLAEHNQVVQEKIGDIMRLKEYLSTGDFTEASKIWESFNHWQQKALWISVKSGGILTTKERKEIKSDDFTKAFRERDDPDYLEKYLDVTKGGDEQNKTDDGAWAHL